MSFNITDDALEALDKSDEPTRTKFFEGLNDEERNSLAAAVPAWKQRRSGVSQQADQFVSTVGQGSQGRTSTSSGMDLGGSPSVAPSTQPTGVPSNPSLSKDVLAPENLAFNPLAPIGAGIGWLGDKARSSQDAVFKSQREGPLGQAFPNAQATGEMLTRSLTGSLLGEGSSEGQPDESKLRAINTMEQHVGPNMTTAALVGAQALGNAAQVMLPVGEVGQLTKNAKTAEKILAAGASGGVQGFALSKFQGSDPLIGAIAGGVLGSAVAGGGEAIKAAAPTVKKFVGKVAEFKDQAAVDLWSKIHAWHNESGMTAPILAEGRVSDLASADKLAPRYKPAEIKPSYARIVDGDEGLKAVIVDYSVGKAPKVAEMPVATEEQAAKFAEYAKKNNIRASPGPESFKAVANLPETHFNYLVKPEVESKYTNLLKDELDLGPDAEHEIAQYFQRKPTEFSRADTPPARPRGKMRGPKPPDVDGRPTQSLSPPVQVSVDPDGHVKLTPIEPDLPKPTPRKGQAQRGYIKQMDANGSPESMIVDRLANDPDAPGNILVEGNKGDLISVPAAEFHPARTPTESIELVKSMGAEPVRVAPPAVPGTLPPGTIDEGRILNEDIKTLVRRNPTYGQAIFGRSQKVGKDGVVKTSGLGLVSNHHMGDRDMAAILLEANAAKDHAAMRGEALHALTKAAGGPKQLNTAMDYDMKNVMSGQMDMADFKGKYPQIAQKVAPLVQNMMERRNALHQELVKLGAVSGDLDQGAMEAYLTQAYYRYLFPKKWAKVMGPNTLEEAAKAITKQMNGRGEKWTGQQVYSELQGILGAENPAQAFYGSEMGKSKAFDSLRAKQELPPFFKNLLGEVKSGMYSMSETLARQEQLVARFRLYHELASNPAYYSHGPQPHLDQRMVPANPREFGPLAGGYVAPEIYDNIIELPKASAHAANFMNKLTSLRKGNQMASILAHFRNNLGSWQSNVLAGGLSPWHPVQGAKDMRDAAKALWSYMGDPTGMSGMGNIVKEMRMAGADWAGHAESEVGKDSPYIREMLKKIAKENGTDAFDITEKLMHGTWGKYKGAIAKNGGLLDLQDRFYRVANYIALKRKFVQNPGRYLPGVGPQDVEKEAIKFAARRINDSFMNSAHVGKSVDALRKSNVGMLAPYGTAMAEEARMLGLIPSRMAEDPDLKWRLAGWGIFGAAGAGALKYGLGGTPPEAFESAQGNMTDMSKAHRVGLLPLPLTGTSDENPVRLFDASQYFLPGQLLAGHPDDGMLQRVFANALLYPMSGGAAEAPERSLLEAAGVVKPINYTPKQLQSEIGLVNFVNQVAHAGGVPAQVTQATDVASKMNYNGRWGQKWSPADAAAKMAFTGYVGPVSPTSPAGIKEDKGERRDLKGELKIINRDFAGGKIDKTTAERKMKIVVDAIKASGAETAERGNLMKSYIDSYQVGKK